MIARTYETKFLSIIIQANRTWKTHIAQPKIKKLKPIAIFNKA